MINKKKARLERRKKMEDKIATYQRKLSKKLKTKEKEMMSNKEYRQMYGTALPKGNDGVLLHAQNMFNPKRYRVQAGEVGRIIRVRK